MPSVELRCPTCEQALHVEARALRASTRCPRCAAQFVPIEVLPREVALPAIVDDSTLPSISSASEPEPAASSSAPDPAPGEPKPTPPLSVRPAKADRQRTLLMGTPVPAELAEPVEIRDRVAEPPPPSSSPHPAPAASKRHGPSGTVIMSGPATKPADATHSSPSQRPSAYVDLGPERPSWAAAQMQRISLAPAALAIERQMTVLRPSAERLLIQVRHRSHGKFGYHHVALSFALPGLAAVVAMVMADTLLLRWSAAFAAFVLLAAAAASLGAHVLLWARDRRGAVPAIEALRPGGGAEDDSIRRALLFAGLAIGGISIGVMGTVAALVRPVADYLHTSRRPQAPTVEAPSEPEPEVRADQELRRAGHLRVSGGIFHVPAAFGSADGAFDLVMHFHGNTELVKESVDEAKLNALVYIENLGIGSGAYEEKFAVPGAFDRTLSSIEAAAEKRGLRDAKVRRVALSSWSAGYGAISKILDLKKNRERVDAVLVLDGIHVARTHGHEVDRVRLDPFLRFAEEAAAGPKLFTITHSDIETSQYASASETADAILRESGGARQPSDPATDSPPPVELRAAVGIVAKKSKQLLEQTSEARVGNLHVRGFSGKTPEHHMAHLMQMSVTVLPELGERWR